MSKGSGPALVLRVFALVLLLVAARSGAEELTVIGFNVQSGGADPQRIARQIKDVEGCDLWGLAEVNPLSAPTFLAAAEIGEAAKFKRILGKSGGDDRLLILYDSDRLSHVRDYELDAANLGGLMRAPLVGQFRLVGTDREFLFMVNHLYEERATRRHRQARWLNEWAALQSLPIVAVGTYGFDWEIPGGDADHDLGYDLLTANGILRWVRPPQLVATQCHPNFRSVLDFVFVGGEARSWKVSSSQILFGSTSYCPDDEEKSDHRPVQVTFDLGGEPEPDPLQELTERVERIEEQLRLGAAQPTPATTPQP